jgi:small-conductance mechanosensitive channel
MHGTTIKRLAGIAILVLLVSGVWAQHAVAAASPGSNTAPVASESGATAEHERAAVTVDGKVLFHVRGVTSYPAEQRALAIRKRIETIAADRSVAADAVRVVETEDRSNIVAGDILVISVLDADAAPEGVTRKQLAEIFRVKVAEAIATHRDDRSPRALMISTLYALGATVVAAMLVFVLRLAFRRLDALLERRYRSRVEGLETQSHQLIQAKQLWKALQGFLETVRFLAVLAIIYLTLNLVLGLYPWTRPLAQRLFSIVLEPLHAMGTGFLEALPNLVFIALLIIVIRYALKITRLFFAGVDHGTIPLSNFDREWAWPTYKIIRLLVIAFALVVAYPYIPGSGSEAFKGISIFLGVLFSLGSSSFIANMIAGYTMTYRRAYRIGDRIKVDDITGDVVEMRLMVTHLRTIKNEEVVVPNSLILNSNIINYSTLAKSRGLILHTTVGIGYETPWRKVEAMLLLAAKCTPGLLKEPAPFVLQKSLGDFAVTYELNVACDNAQGMAGFYTALHHNILDVFNEYGVQIMVPAYEGDPEAPKVVPREQWFAAPAADVEPQNGKRGPDSLP